MKTRNADRTDVVVQARGRVSSADHVYAHTKATAVAAHAPVPVLYTKVDLLQHDDPARIQPAFAKIELDVNGQIVRAHATGSTMHEAIDTMEARLRQQLEHFRDVRDARRRRHRERESWHHRDEVPPPPAYFPRAEEEREVIRRKTFAVGAQTPREAADSLELLGHDFYLFWNADTDEDSVLHRIGNQRYELIEVKPHFVADADGAIKPSSLRPSTMDEKAAVELVTLGDEPFVFFVDSATGRGRVVHRRYDGHYGLITAVDDLS